VKRDLGTAAIGAGAGGLLDAIYATVLWGFILGDNPAAVWQSVAAGLLGKASYDGGKATALLGLTLHFCIAFVMALVYVRAARHLALLRQRPVLMGALYGVLLYLAMNYVVVPLSATAYELYKERAAIAQFDTAPLVLSCIVSFVSALLAVKFLIRFVSRHSFAAFAWYRIVFGGVILLTAWTGLVRW